MNDTPDQSAEVGFTPPQWLIRWITSAQIAVYEFSGGRVWTSGANMAHLVLYTIGRKSGRQFKACLPYWLDTNGQRIVVASYAGATHHPGWYHNLADRNTNPTVGVLDKTERFKARAEILDGADYDQVWKDLTRDRPFYANYQLKTSRKIPLIRLLEAR